MQPKFELFLKTLKGFIPSTATLQVKHRWFRIQADWDSVGATGSQSFFFPYREDVVAQPTYLTPHGLTTLKAELEELRTRRRQAVAERIQKAKEIGGTVDNAEYDEAKNEQAFIEGRIMTLESLINNAEIISTKSGPSDVVHIGSVVTVLNQKGKKGKYTIIGSAEADPAHGKVSNVSPIGQALLGKRVGDVAEVNAPAGKLKLEVVSIR